MQYNKKWSILVTSKKEDKEINKLMDGEFKLGWTLLYLPIFKGRHNTGLKLSISISRTESAEAEFEVHLHIDAKNIATHYIGSWPIYDNLASAVDKCLNEWFCSDCENWLLEKAS